MISENSFNNNSDKPKLIEALKSLWVAYRSPFEQD